MANWHYVYDTGSVVLYVYLTSLALVLAIVVGSHGKKA